MSIYKFFRFSLIIFSALFLFQCNTSGPAGKNYISYVNPFIGTVGNGNTFFGPSMPYGMVKPGPPNHKPSFSANRRRRRKPWDFSL